VFRCPLGSNCGLFGRIVLSGLLLAVAGCGRDADRPPPADPATSLESDAIVLRVPRAGGEMRAAVFPALDSVVWSASGLPALARVLAFDPEAGLLAVVTRAGHPAHIDLRLGRATTASRQTLRSLSSVNGSDIFAVDARGRVVRFSPAGTWSFTPPVPATGIHPQPTGIAFVSASSGAQSTVWRMHPPDDRLLDSAYFPPLGRIIGTAVGDRLYLVTDTAVVSVTARTLEAVSSLRTPERVVAAAPTPSGDRLYIATHGTAHLRVLSRFAEGRATEVRIPDEASDLRMDPLGRYVLVRAAGPDSAWVVAVGTNRMIASIATRWTADLPAVAPDGTIATISGRDVVFVDPESRAETRVAGGASDFWIFIHWNGFRPRAAGLDAPVEFPAETLTDTVQLPGSDTLASDPPLFPQQSVGYTVSFAAVLSAERAARLADSIAVGGARAHVVTSSTAGATLYRVVLGPYTTRANAEAAGAASRRPYWVFEGAP
jgi:hypothetical protein